MNPISGKLNLISGNQWFEEIQTNNPEEEKTLNEMNEGSMTSQTQSLIHQK